MLTIQNKRNCEKVKNLVVNAHRRSIAVPITTEIQRIFNVGDRSFVSIHSGRRLSFLEPNQMGTCTIVNILESLSLIDTQAHEKSIDGFSQNCLIWSIVWSWLNYCIKSKMIAWNWYNWRRWLLVKILFDLLDFCFCVGAKFNRKMSESLYLWNLTCFAT